MPRIIFSRNIFLGAVLPLLLTAIGLGLLIGLKTPEPKENRLPELSPAGLLPLLPIAEVAPVRFLSGTLDIDVNGTVVPFREIELAAEVEGRIIEKDPEVRSGNYVKQGQVLYKVDPEDYALEVERLSQKRDQELAMVKELNLDIENSKLLLDVAEEELELAHDEVKRLESLSRNFSSVAELDQAKRSRLTSLNQRVNIENQIRTLETRRSRLELAARLAETELRKARLNLSRSVVTSPVDGRIVSDQAEKDSFVKRGDRLVVIEDTSKLEVACNLRMDQLHWILDQAAISTEQIVNAAQAARYELPPTEVEIRYRVAGREAFECKWHGVLDRFDGEGLDPQSRTVPIRIRVDHPELVSLDGTNPLGLGGSPMLVRGMYVQATIKAKPATRLMLVPKLAIKPATGTSVVWKFKPDDKAMYETTLAKKALAAEKSGLETPVRRTVRDGQESTQAAARNSDEEQAGESREEDSFNPDEWIGGYLTIVHGVRVVRAYEDEENNREYWVCEVPRGQLSVDDEVVVTPLPGIKADNRDAIRVAKPGSGEGSYTLASTSTSGGSS